MKDMFDKVSTLRVHGSTKKLLESLMLPRESFDDALYRLLSELKKSVSLEGVKVD